MQDADNANKEQTTYSRLEGKPGIGTLNNKTNLYAIYTEMIKDVAWDENAGGVTSPDTVTAADAAVTLTNNTGNARRNWTIVVPTNLPDGLWQIAVSDNAVPAYTDEVLFTRACNISSGTIQTMDNR